MDVRLSDRVNAIKPSPTLAVTNKAAELKAAGKNVNSEKRRAAKAEAIIGPILP